MKLTHRYDSALAFASAAHREHYRKGTDVPYITHLLHVSAIVMEAEGTEDACIAALLHDAVEDVPERFGGAETLKRYIEAEWGSTVLKTVLEVTDSEGHPKPPWEERKRQKFDGLLTMSPAGRLVAAADKLANLRSIRMEYRRIGDRVWEKFNKGREESLANCRRFVDRLHEVLPSTLVDELDDLLLEMENYETR